MDVNSNITTSSLFERPKSRKQKGRSALVLQRRLEEDEGHSRPDSRSSVEFESSLEDSLADFQLPITVRIFSFFHFSLKNSLKQHAMARVELSCTYSPFDLLGHK